MMLKYLKMKKSGAMFTSEFVIASPFMFMIAAIVLFFTIMLFSWINYSSFAQNIAEGLNFHQTGLARAQYLNDASLSQIKIIDGTGYTSFNGSQLEVHVRNDSGELPSTEYRNAVIYSLLQNKIQLGMPYSHVDKVIVDVYKEGNNTNLGTSNDAKAANFAGAVVNVSVQYSFAQVGINQSPDEATTMNYQVILPGFSMSSHAMSQMI